MNRVYCGVHTYLLTYSLTSCSTVLLQKLTGFQPVKKFPVFFGTRKFIATFTRARYLSQSEPEQSSLYFPVPHPEDQFYYYLPICACVFRVGPFSQVFPQKPCMHLSLIRATYPAHLILLDSMTQTIFGEQYKSLSSSLCSFLHSPVTSSLSGSTILLKHPFLKHTQPTILLQYERPRFTPIQSNRQSYSIS